MITEERKKELRAEFGFFDDSNKKDMLWAIMDKLSTIETLLQMVDKTVSLIKTPYR